MPTVTKPANPNTLTVRNQRKYKTIEIKINSLYDTLPRPSAWLDRSEAKRLIKALEKMLEK